MSREPLVWFSALAASLAAWMALDGDWDRAAAEAVLAVVALGCAMIWTSRRR